MERPGVGVGIIVVNSEGKVLIGRRMGFAPYYSIPGGHLEKGETFEECAEKEMLEETGMIISDIKVLSVTNNLETYKQDGKHYVSINVVAGAYEGQPQILEPDKIVSWDWYDIEDLPEPHFEASRLAIECYKAKVFYNQQR